jgi:hypothetical protein
LVSGAAAPAAAYRRILRKKPPLSATPTSPPQGARLSHMADLLYLIKMVHLADV